MKKILLTSALVGTTLLASAAVANPTVTVGGFIDFQAGLTDQDSTHEVGANSRNAKFQNDTEVHINVEGTSDSGLIYGAQIELEADVTSDADNEGLNADKTFIYLQGENFGRFELGSNTDAAAQLKVDASSIARATGGIDGDFYDFAGISTVGNGQFIISPDLPTAHALGVREDSNKITYVSPRFSGLQLGVSYSPDQGDVGTAAGFTGENGFDQENVFNLGLNYQYMQNDFDVEASLTGEFGSAENAAQEDLEAWALGLALSYREFHLAGSYGDWTDSDQLVGAANDSDFWTLGTAYVNGPAGVSITYLDSEYATNEFTNLVVGADYSLAPGLVPYVEVSFFDLDAGAGAANSNDGTVFLIGTELTF